MPPRSRAGTASDAADFVLTMIGGLQQCLRFVICLTESDMLGVSWCEGSAGLMFH